VLQAECNILTKAWRASNCHLKQTSEVEVTLRLTVSQSVCLGVGHPIGAHDQILLFPFFFRKIALLFVLGRSLWREDGSVICSAIYQWSESQRTYNHTLLSHLRLLGSLSVACYDSQGLRWKYSYPPPHGEHKHTNLFSIDKTTVSRQVPRWKNSSSVTVWLLLGEPLRKHACLQSRCSVTAVAA
jgi:hypothetical protein